MTWRDLDQATQALQQGHPQVASRIFRMLLRDGELNPQQQALAYMGLSQTTSDSVQQRDYLQRAAHLDPQNTNVNRALSDFISRQLSESQRMQAIKTPAPLGDTSRINPVVPPDPLSDTSRLGRAIPGIDPFTDPSRLGKPVDGRVPVPPIDPRLGAAFPRDAAPQPTYNPPPAPLSLPHQHGNTNTLPYLIEHVQRSVGILGGSNSPASGFFISHDGLIATSHFAVGSVVRVEVDLLDGQRLMGQVVRAFPSYDLALVRVHARINSLPRFATMAYLAENTPLLVTPHLQDVLRTTRRATRDTLPPQWFPTELNQLPDSGGAAITSANGQEVVGMITRNAPRANGFFVGLYMAVIMQQAAHYIEQAHHFNGHETYCPTCGALSSASFYDAHYCPACGAVYPYAQQRVRTATPNMAAFYGENAAPCGVCQSRVGTYQNRCLRCGSDLSPAGRQRR